MSVLFGVAVVIAAVVGLVLGAVLLVSSAGAAVGLASYVTVRFARGRKRELSEDGGLDDIF